MTTAQGFFEDQRAEALRVGNDFIHGRDVTRGGDNRQAGGAPSCYRLAMMRFLFAFSLFLGLGFPAMPTMARNEPSLIVQLSPGVSMESLAARGFGRLDPLFPAHRDRLDPLSRFYRLIPADTRALALASVALASDPSVVSAMPDQVSTLAGCLPDLAGT